jgi:hypothetical protein
VTIINDDYRVVNKLETSLTDDARVVINDHQRFIVQASGACAIKTLQIPWYASVFVQASESY